MGKITGGANGPFSGKVGSTIGSKWRDIKYIKGLPKPSTKPPSAAQLLQRERFNLINNFVCSIKEVLKKGFGGINRGYSTELNFALSYNARHALKPGVCEIDFARICLSDGPLAKPKDARAAYTGDRSITLNWNPAVRSAGMAADDEATVLIYCQNHEVPEAFVAEACRRDGSLVCHSQFFRAGEICHPYIFFTSRKGVSSPTFYIGEMALK